MTTYEMPKQPESPFVVLYDAKGWRWQSTEHKPTWWVSLDRTADSGSPVDCWWHDLVMRHGPLTDTPPERCIAYVWFEDTPDGEERCLLAYGHEGHHKLNERRWALIR